MRTAMAALVLAAAVTAAAGCGGSPDATRDRLVVSAAASLTEPLRACSRAFDGARVRLSFAGSDELAAQIRRGVRPDVFAAASTTLPDELAREGLLETPRSFAANELVVAVPRSSRIDAVEDLGATGVRVAIGTPAVPVGAYAREVLGRLAPSLRARIVANVRTREPSVAGIVGKVAQGAVDAGFVYATDVAAADGLRAVSLPARARPAVAYAAGVVKGAPNPDAAGRYVHGLIRGACAHALREAGFGPAP